MGPLERLAVKTKDNIKCVVKKLYREVYIGFVSLRIWTTGGLFFFFFNNLLTLLAVSSLIAHLSFS